MKSHEIMRLFPEAKSTAVPTAAWNRLTKIRQDPPRKRYKGSTEHKRAITMIPTQDFCLSSAPQPLHYWVPPFICERRDFFDIY